MPRTLLVVALGAPLIAWSWLRMEDGNDAGLAALVVLLALVPLVIPTRRLRALTAAVTLLVVGAIAFDLGPSWALPGRVLARFGDGFLEFYDVQIPFNPDAHPRMHGVLLVAVFAFTLWVALAAAARRPGLVALALVVGVGWPGTLLPGHDLLRGGLLLVAILVATALLRRGPVRSLGVAAAAGAVIVTGALFAADSSALAKRAFLDWQHWDLYTKPAKPIDVSYVWNSSYRGLTFKGKPTTVFRVKAGPEPHYWRSSVLNTVEGGRWFEELSPEFGDPSPIGEIGMIPRREELANRWEHEIVTVEALRDHRLPGGSVPVRYAPSRSMGRVLYDPSGVAYANDPVHRGQSYQVWSYAPTPTPQQLARSKAQYSGPIVTPETRKYREVQPGVYPPLFGQPGRLTKLKYLFTGFARADELRPFATLYNKALEVAGGARSPYAAAVALEQWFRFGGGFVYDQHPPKAPLGVPALEDFVARTQRGYCQHFAGAMALMLRYLGIPSRVAVGFASGRYDAKSREWVVSDRDAHMWVEVWFRGWGWLPFDPTPGRGGLAGRYSASSPSFDIGATAAVLAGKEGLNRFQSLAGALGFGGKARTSPDVPELGAVQSAGTGSSHRSRDWGILRLLLFGIAGTVFVLAAGKVLLRGSRFLTRDPRRLAAASRKELRDFLLDQGFEIPQSATLRELAGLVEQEYGVDAGAFGLHATAARFGPLRSAGEAARAMRRDLRAIRRGIRRELTRGERVRGLLSLRSLGLA